MCACVCVHACVRTSSVMVAENNMVCLLKEHILMISFICSSKYSSSILTHTDTHTEIRTGEKTSGGASWPQDAGPVTLEGGV